MKKLILIPLFFILTACSGEVNTTTPAIEDLSSQALSKTPGLEDCILYSFSKEQYDHRLNINRCDGKSTVSVNQVQKQGKTTIQTTTVMIDGKEYKPVQ